MGSWCDVSVIIPTYNRLSFLKDAVKSVLDQTISPREVIVVDDGSDDGTHEWLSAVADERLKCVRQERQGPGVARNLGVSLSRCKWAAFLDSDDWWLPGKLEAQISFLAKNPSYQVCQTEEIWIRNGLRVNPMKKHRKHSGYIFERCLERCIISPSAVLMEREFFEKLGGFDPEFPVCEDYDLWLRASLESPVETLSAPLVVKRGGHQDQLSKKYQAMDRFRVKAMEKILAAAILTDPQREALLKELKKKLGVLAGGFMKRYPEQFNPYARKLSDYFEASHG